MIRVLLLVIAVLPSLGMAQETRRSTEFGMEPKHVFALWTNINAMTTPQRIVSGYYRLVEVEKKAPSDVYGRVILATERLDIVLEHLAR